jgi:hypothetical protein
VLGRLIGSYLPFGVWLRREKVERFTSHDAPEDAEDVVAL